MDKDTQELLNVGSDILKSVSKAIDTNDYSKLASEISKSVKATSFERRTTYASGVNTAQRNNSTYTQRQNVQYTRRAPDIRKYPFLQKRIPRYSGLGRATMGLTFAFFMLLPFLASVLVEANLLAAITLGAITAIFGLIGFSGVRRFKLVKKFYQYGSILKDAQYFKISDLATAAMKSDKEVEKDIKDMMAAGFIPRARLDSTGTTCMITDAAYQMYLGAEQDRLAREEKQAQEAALLRGNNKSEETSSGVPSNVQSLVNDGNEYIKFVRDINDVIPDTEEMSNKLYRLESIMNRIFEQVKKDPSSADELHKLMAYYLPTTKKLLTAYVELDKQGGNGENVQQTKKEIDLAMDTINLAFENLLDSLFQEMAWDISSDISVMKTMMAQDGLTNEGQMAMASSGAATATMAAGSGAMAMQEEE